MPKFNADEKTFEEIELVLNGKAYSVQTINQTMFEKIKEASEQVKVDGDMNVVAKQLGIILGADPKEFEGVDLRKAGAALKFLTDSITSQIEGKSGNA